MKKILFFSLITLPFFNVIQAQNVGIGTTNPTVKLEVVGQVKITGGWPALEVVGQVKITGGTPGEGKVLTSDSNGVAKWITPSVNVTHFIGEAYGGGIVFYVTPNALHGLIAATSDLGDTWYAAQNSISAFAIYSGQNYTDWRLPTRYELNLLWIQQSILGVFNYTYYWSSTEDDYSTAYTKDFFNGVEFILSKSSQLGIRAVRSF